MQLPQFISGLILCAVPFAHGLSITALESDCITLYVEVTYGADDVFGYDYEEYYIPNSGILSFGVYRDGDFWNCHIYPDDVEENDRFLLPLDFTILTFQSVTYWIPAYRVENHGWGFTIVYDDDYKAPRSVPDSASSVAMLAFGIGAVVALRVRRSRDVRRVEVGSRIAD